MSKAKDSMTSEALSGVIKPSQLKDIIRQLIKNKIMHPLMIWGPPGVGKSSIVQQVAAEFGMGFYDVRLGQLSPLDLRGLPRAQQVNFGTAEKPIHSEVTAYVAPRFLPRPGTGPAVLILDEFNMASPNMMGLAQELLLDRRMGDYVLPDDVWIIAAGNRKIDGAAVNTMPKPVGNRMLHLDMKENVEEWTAHALRRNFNTQIVAFINFRPELMHKVDLGHQNWPSPRTWEFASNLHEAGIDVSMAVGPAAASEFNAFVRVYSSLPDLKAILEGGGGKFPKKEPGAAWAAVIGMAAHIQSGRHLGNAVRWINNSGMEENLEWTTLLTRTLSGIDDNKMLTYFGDLAAEDPDMADVVMRISNKTSMN